MTKTIDAQAVGFIEDTKSLKIQHVRRGSFVRIQRAGLRPGIGGDGFNKKTYKLEGYNRDVRKYWLDDMDDCSRGRWLQRDAVVQVGFTY